MSNGGGPPSKKARLHQDRSVSGGPPYKKARSNQGRGEAGIAGSPTLLQPASSPQTSEGTLDTNRTARLRTYSHVIFQLRISFFQKLTMGICLAPPPRPHLHPRLSSTLFSCPYSLGGLHGQTESGEEYSPSMLEPVRPGAVPPDRAVCLPTLSHFVIVNKTSLSLSLSL
jgi:hypothetical protein